MVDLKIKFRAVVIILASLVVLMLLVSFIFGKRLFKGFNPNPAIDKWFGWSPYE